MYFSTSALSPLIKASLFVYKFLNVSSNFLTKSTLSDLYNCADGSTYFVTYTLIPSDIYDSNIAAVVLTISSSSNCKNIVFESTVVPNFLTSFPATTT